MVGGSLTSDAGTTAPCDDTVTSTCVVANNYNSYKSVPGVATIRTRWRISSGVDAQTLFIEVQSESTAPLAGRRSRAEFTTFRTCTRPGC